MRMVVQRKAIFLSIVVALLVVLQWGMPGHPGMVAWYSRYIFHPFQAARGALLGWLPFSLGDALYLAVAALLVFTVGKWFYFLARFRSRRGHLLASVLQTCSVAGIAYIIFFLGFGGNYYKQPLARTWSLPVAQWDEARDLAAYDSSLIARLNALAPAYRDLSFGEANAAARDAYRTHTTNPAGMRGVRAKPSMYGGIIRHIHVQGYYNPFTGEAQVDAGQPAFMQPFVMLHEMAHQSGIAAEGDANLLAYALCANSADPAFQYSGALNVWLYTHARLHTMDSARANALLAGLNPLTRAQRDTLRAIRRSYRGAVGEWAGSFYDGYLKLHQQRKGIRSYNAVTEQAWAYDRKGVRGALMLP